MTKYIKAGDFLLDIEKFKREHSFNGSKMLNFRLVNYKNEGLFFEWDKSYPTEINSVRISTKKNVTYLCSDNLDDLISAIVIEYPHSGRRIFPRRYLRKYTKEQIEEKLKRGYRIFGYCWETVDLKPKAELKLEGWKVYD